MNRTLLVVAALTTSILVACASTEYKTYEGRNNVVEGRGGTKVVVDGMEVWDNGEPPRKFRILGIIEDARPGGIIPMSQLRSDMVKKARESGGEAVVQLNSESQIASYYSTGSATAYGLGSSATGLGTSTTMVGRRNYAKFAVIKFVD